MKNDPSGRNRKPMAQNDQNCIKSYKYQGKTIVKSSLTLGQ
ncbi:MULTISPECIES: hypothetical protein [Salegentibacter]|nr:MULTISPECIES: hypothetical protein [Salegentibacter]